MTRRHTGAGDGEHGGAQFPRRTGRRRLKPPAVQPTPVAQAKAGVEAKKVGRAHSAGGPGDVLTIVNQIRKRQVMPGRTSNTPMPCGASRSARPCVNIASPALEMQ